jgi:hypothetical protein
MSQEMNNCPICLIDIDDTRNKIITNCGHHFHCLCLMQNVKKNGFACPCCRTLINEEEKSKEVTQVNNDDEIPELVEVEVDSSVPFYFNRIIAPGGRNIVSSNNNIYSFTSEMWTDARTSLIGASRGGIAVYSNDRSGETIVRNRRLELERNMATERARNMLELLNSTNNTISPLPIVNISSINLPRNNN